ncbi:MAG: hypothetical protein VR70_04020 [Rhodospirillaceae bacterium BRH_c57]|nr:MAG: hypothetical protein VR70_04020 [Rhodospirillaceae bacterium BRH_c57]
MAGIGNGIRVTLLAGTATAVLIGPALAGGDRVDLDTIDAVVAEMQGQLPENFDIDLSLMDLRAVIVEAINTKPDAEGLRSATRRSEGMLGPILVGVQAERDGDGCYRVVSNVLTAKGKAGDDTKLCRSEESVAGAEVLTADASKWVAADNEPVVPEIETAKKDEPKGFTLGWATTSAASSVSAPVSDSRDRGEKCSTDSTGVEWCVGLHAVAVMDGHEISEIPVTRDRPTLGLFDHMSEMPSAGVHLPARWKAEARILYKGAGEKSSRVEVFAEIRNKVKGCELKLEGRGEPPAPTDGSPVKITAVTGDAVSIEWSCPTEDLFSSNAGDLAALTDADPELVIYATTGGQDRSEWQDLGNYFVYRNDAMPSGDRKVWDVPASEHVRMGFAATWNEIPREWLAAAWKEGDKLALNNKAGYQWATGVMDGSANVVVGSRFGVVAYEGNILNDVAGEAVVAVVSRRLGGGSGETPCSFEFGLKDAAPSVSAEAWSPSADHGTAVLGGMTLPGEVGGSPGVAPVEGRFGCAVSNQGGKQGGLAGNTSGEVEPGESGVEHEIWIRTEGDRGFRRVSGGRALHAQTAR